MNTTETTTTQLKDLFNSIELGVTNRELIDVDDTIKMCQQAQKTAYETAAIVVEQLGGTPTTKIIRLKDALIKNGYFKS